MPNVASPGPSPSPDDEVRLSGARAEFVGSLPRRLDALRAALDSAAQAPSDPARANGLLRRVHAVGAAARVLGFASVAEALGEAEKTVRKATAAGQPPPLEDVARALDLLPSLVLGAPVSMRTPDSHERAPFHVWPISVLVYGAAPLAESLAGDDDDTRIERERTEDPARARELARIVGPDVVVIDADRPGARDLVADLARDPLVEPAPIVVVGTFGQPEAAGGYVELGAARVLLKPCSPDTLKRTVHELRNRAAEPRQTRDPLGSVTVPALAERIASEFRRGLVEALEGSPALEVRLGEGHDVLAAVWGAVARVRELVTLHSAGGLRFQPTGPEGAVPLAPFRAEERRAGERGTRETRSGEGVSLNGRRIVVADDDPAVVWFMAGLLKAVGAEVIEAHDGRQALELVYARFPDAVISDVLMPQLDGFSLCHEIKRDVVVRDVPVILLSWKEDLLQRLRELGADADGYLRKEAAASAVVERVREVLHPRARIEERIASGGEVRGRLDGLTARLVLELACRTGGDLRVSLRDAAFLYEMQIRSGHLRSVTRTAPDGSFVRGEPVLGSLLGVSAGRFVIESDASPCRAEFSGDLHTVLARPVALARSALVKVAERSLVRLEHLTFDRALVEAYLTCTPEPAASLTRRLLAGERGRDLVLSGEVSPRLLEAVLSDVARRGGVLDATLAANASSAPPRVEPLLTADEVRSVPAPVVTPGAPAATLSDVDESSVFAALASEPGAEPEPQPDSDSRPSIPHAAFVVNREDTGWFSLAVEPTAEPPAVAPSAESAPVSPPAESAAASFTTSDEPLRVLGSESRPPSNDESTPGNWQAGPLFAFGSEHQTLPGMGDLPPVEERAPEPDAAERAAAATEPDSTLDAASTSSAAPDQAEPASETPGPASVTAETGSAGAAPVAPSEPTAVTTEAAPETAAEPTSASAMDDVKAGSDAEALPAPAPDAASKHEPESRELELADAVTDASDDDDRATFPIPERVPVPVSPVPASPLPEPAPVANERSAPTQPPSRVARKPVQPAERKESAPSERKESVAGFLVKSVLAAAGAFLVTTWLVPKIFPDDRKEPDAAATTKPPPPVVVAPPPSEPADTKQAFTLKAEAMATPPGVSLDPAQGLVDIELTQASSIKVDDAFVGRFDKRRLLLAPGTHSVEVENEQGRATLDLEVTAGRALRVTSGSPGPASGAPSGSE